MKNRHMRQRVVGVLQREARHVALIPVDLKMPKCHVRVNELPDTIKKLLEVSSCPAVGKESKDWRTWRARMH